MHSQVYTHTKKSNYLIFKLLSEGLKFIFSVGARARIWVSYFQILRDSDIFLILCLQTTDTAERNEQISEVIEYNIQTWQG